ncbi:MAG: hypothetical protein MK160_10320 [Rhodobacteraceae bacterium]|nr:hypothetical protein [Paracoccaceae bacterium]
MLRVLIAFVFAWPSVTLAGFVPVEPLGVEDALPEKFALDGTTLIYDTDQAKDQAQREIEGQDVDAFLAVLSTHSAVKTLQLNSIGGEVWAGNEIARIVIDFELDTVVAGECSSSCVPIFLAGNVRQMTRGSKIGFHQSNWSADGLKKYYDKWRDDENWETAFDFASWLFKDTQSEVFKELTYMISRGVDAEFAIQTKQMRSSMWFPSRRILQQAGVLRSDTR